MIITRVVDNTYYAELIIKRGAELISVDARPSDSIAIALRMAAPIFTTEDLLDNTAIEVAEPGDELEDPDRSEEPAGPEKLTPEQLREHLRRMNPEDFGRFNP